MSCENVSSHLFRHVSRRTPFNVTTFLSRHTRCDVRMCDVSMFNVSMCDVRMFDVSMFDVSMFAVIYLGTQHCVFAVI